MTRACNLRIFRPEHFEPDTDRAGGVRLVHPALRRFFLEWETFLAQSPRGAWHDNGPGWAISHALDAELQPRRGAPAGLDVRTLIDRQIERLVADLRGGPIYRPFRYGEPCEPSIP